MESVLNKTTGGMPVSLLKTWKLVFLSVIFEIFNDIYLVEHI